MYKAKQYRQLTQCTGKIVESLYSHLGVAIVALTIEGVRVAQLPVLLRTVGVTSIAEIEWHHWSAELQRKANTHDTHCSLYHKRHRSRYFRSSIVWPTSWLNWETDSMEKLKRRHLVSETVGWFQLKAISWQSEARNLCIVNKRLILNNVTFQSQSSCMEVSLRKSEDTSLFSLTVKCINQTTKDLTRIIYYLHTRKHQINNVKDMFAYLVGISIWLGDAKDNRPCHVWQQAHVFVFPVLSQ